MLVFLELIFNRIKMINPMQPLRCEACASRNVVCEQMFPDVRMVRDLAGKLLLVKENSPIEECRESVRAELRRTGEDDTLSPLINLFP